jgi:hypothetical protein
MAWLPSLHADIARDALASETLYAVINRREAFAKTMKKPTANLAVIVRTYIREIRPRAEAELACFRNKRDLETAIEHAALAINSEGRRYSHQRRIKRQALEEARKILLKEKAQLAAAIDFDEFFNAIEAALQSVSGLGELYLYDTSLRLGARLNLEPKRVYLHAGTRVGARALGLNWKKKALNMSDVPATLQSLRPHEIEDVLCIFKDRFNTPISDAEPLRSWCN